MRPVACLALCLLALLLATRPACAHETRPAWLELKETAPGRFDVLLRTPVLAGMRLPIVLRFPDGVRDVSGPRIEDLADSRVERRTIDAGPKGLAGRRVELVGLQLTITDVLVRVELLDGRTFTTIARPNHPWVEVADAQGRLEVFTVYGVQGLRHILSGADHLLFVLGLLLIVSSGVMLVKTVTAFTVAHSITLGLATLGYVTVPLPPLEACIALSIMFLGGEVVRKRRGGTSLTLRNPWVAAFLFGLLHGFGFASGLSIAGMPHDSIPLALLSFNVGVELGQLLFVFLALTVMRAFTVLGIRWPPWSAALPAYAVGSLGAFWTIQRTLAMLGGGG